MHEQIPMTHLEEREAMICRSCGNEERASEGYPCSDCGTFVCMMCAWRGMERCAACTVKAAALPSAHARSGFTNEPIMATPVTPALTPPPPVLPTPAMDWPEH